MSRRADFVKTKTAFDPARLHIFKRTMQAFHLPTALAAPKIRTTMKILSRMLRKFWLIGALAATTSFFPFSLRADVFKMVEVADLPSRPEMPDPLTMNDGRKVTTREQWRARREEMKQILEFYELGHAPPPPGNVPGHFPRSSIHHFTARPGCT